MKAEELRRLVAGHREKQIRFPDDTPESFWLGYDAAMYDFLRLLDEQIAFGEKGFFPGDFVMELQPMIPAGRGLYRKAPQHQIIDLLGGLIQQLETRINRWYETFRPNIHFELNLARQSLTWAEDRLRAYKATPVKPDYAHSHNPEYELKLEGLAERARTFIAENVGSGEFKRFPVGKPRDHSRSFVEGE